jgi:hypothetical protein
MHPTGHDRPPTNSEAWLASPLSAKAALRLAHSSRTARDGTEVRYLARSRRIAGLVVAGWNHASITSSGTGRLLIYPQDPGARRTARSRSIAASPPGIWAATTIGLAGRDG